jgi:hypothetical protein
VQASKQASKQASVYKKIGPMALDFFVQAKQGKRKKPRKRGKGSKKKNSNKKS